MDLKNLFKLALRTFRTRPARTGLTILGMAIGIGAILVFVSLGYGLQKTMLEQITTADSLLSLDVATANPEVLPLNQKRISEISAIANVEEVSPLTILSGQISLGPFTSDASFYLAHPSYFRLAGIVAKEGRVFEKEDEKKLVLSSALLKSLNLEREKALGREVKVVLFITKRTETGEEEVGIFETKESYQISGIIDDETTSFVYISLATLKDLEIEDFAQLKVKVTEGKFINEVSENLTNMGFLVSSLAETIEEANKIFRAIQIILGVFGVVALFVAAIGMANTMTVTLLERTNEIGIMKAIGAADRDIGRMFLVESIIIGLLGGAGGIGINYLISGILNFGINMLAQGLGGQAMNLFFTPFWFIIFIIVFSILVGILSGIFPARRAAKMDPLEALRYK